MLAAVLCGVVVAMNVGKVPIAMTELRSEFGLSLVAAGWVSSMINTLGVTTALLFRPARRPRRCLSDVPDRPACQRIGRCGRALRRKRNRPAGVALRRRLGGSPWRSRRPRC
ncbi:MAG: hypothetical protein M5R42_04485 [Rhodocyclaceae bacterium]|nr:hypothetical protein [Rhodocyclaceae bacterium]